MRNENLLNLISLSLETVVSPTQSGQQIFCNTVFMSMATRLDPRGMGNQRGRAIAAGAEKLWVKAEAAGFDPKATMRDLGLFGAFKGGYFRRFAGNGFETHMQERFVRCFDHDAVFCCEKAHVQITVWESGKLAGIVMPYDASPESVVVPFLEDDVLYHYCDKEGDY